MATYFHGNSSHSQIQASASASASAGGGSGGGLQTLILMNPTTTTTTDYNNVAGYSDTSTTTTTQPSVFLNSNCGGGNSFNAPPPSSQQFPFASAATSSEDNNISLLDGFLPRVQQHNNHHLYNNNQKVVVVDHNMEARENPHVQRGLSLSLSSQLSAYGAKRELPPSTLIDDMRVSASAASGGMMMQQQQNHHVLLSSNYLKAAQQLLDEVVNVGDSVTIAKVEQPPSKAAAASASASGGREGGSGCEKGGKRDGELTTAEKQEIQMKKAKLVNMLDEVEQRYRQYQQQMQMVATMFEEACGIGSAKAYTALALQTISKQFRSIKDAVLCQVRIASKSLGEEEDEDEDSNIKGTSSSRMKNIDNQMRQQRALQQLGMIHHNAWRPQRGLPERSVSVLRSWLFQHFLHPYPKDSDKIMLAKQAGLTRGQVSNWFINARVRLWKPMVEEMYSKEMKEQEKKTVSDEKSGKSEQTAFNTATDPDKTSTMDNQNNGYDVLNQDFPINHQNITHSPASMSSASQARIYMQNQPGHFDLIGSPEMESISKKQRCTDIMFGTPTGVRMDTAKPDDESDNEHLSMKFDTEKQRREDGFTLFGGPTTHFINGGFNTYPIAEQLGRFNNNDQQFPSPYSATNNGVSLSLGLPHCENLAMSGPHQTFELARGVEDIGDARDFGSIPHRVIVPEYMRESTFRNARGLMDNYYQTL